MRGQRSLTLAMAAAALLGSSCTCGSELGSVSTASPEASALVLGSPLTGRFTTNLPRDDRGKAHIDYQLRLEEAGTFQIELTSANTGVYDPYLRLLREGRQVAEDDDGAEAPLQARIVEDLEPGQYVVRVTKFGSQQVDEATDFTLSAVRIARPAPAEPPPPTPLSAGSAATGRLSPTSPTDEAGIPFVDYSLTVVEPGEYRIDLESADTRAYDPLVRVLRDGREVGADDDGGDSALQARLELTLEPGTYVVRASKFGPGPIRAPVALTLLVTRQGGGDAAPPGGP